MTTSESGKLIVNSSFAFLHTCTLIRECGSQGHSLLDKDESYIGDGWEETCLDWEGNGVSEFAAYHRNFISILT